MRYAVSKVELLTYTHELAQLLLSLPNEAISSDLEVDVIDASTMEKPSIENGDCWLNVGRLRIKLRWAETIRRLMEKQG
jgi:hypothetical protein